MGAGYNLLEIKINKITLKELNTTKQVIHRIIVGKIVVQYLTLINKTHRVASQLI